MNKSCLYFHAIRFENESAGMCFKSGKVVLLALNYGVNIIYNKYTYLINNND